MPQILRRAGDHMSASPQNETRGALRRKVILSAGERLVVAGVEDDFHHFVITLEHDGSRITGVKSEDKRTPWAICASAGSMLQQLVGVSLSMDVFAAVAHIDPHQQCTHQFDLALLAIPQALRGGRRQYDIEVTDPIDGKRRAHVLRDGNTCIDWTMEGTTIIAPSALAGTNLRQMNVREVAERDPDIAEAIVTLRRAVMIASGRGINLDQFESASVFADRMSGACYSFQPTRIMLATRNKGTVRDFAQHPELLLSDFQE